MELVRLLAYQLHRFFSPFFCDFCHMFGIIQNLYPILTTYLFMNPEFLPTPPPKELILSSTECQRRTQEALEYIDGYTLQKDLLGIAAVGGEQIPSTQEQARSLDYVYATHRLALTKQDMAGRAYVQEMMREIDMEIDSAHPLALIGICRGRNPSLPPVVVMSHIDTVPGGGMFDGVPGVMAGIRGIEAMMRAGIEPERDIMVIAVTGEESSRFNLALIGSKALFHGLSEADLDAYKEGDISLREAITRAYGEQALALVQQPYFGENCRYSCPTAVAELHVNQDDELVRQGKDLGIVESVAAPVRYGAQIQKNGPQVGGQSLSELASGRELPHFCVREIILHGTPGHSGTLDMSRCVDGLVHAAQMLIPCIDTLVTETVRVKVCDLQVVQQAMNKVPGEVRIVVQVSASSESELEDTVQRLAQEVLLYRHMLPLENTLEFGEKERSFPLSEEGSLHIQEMRGMYGRIALYTALIVQSVVYGYADKGVVGTVGT